jgi:hypothetical protein
MDYEPPKFTLRPLTRTEIEPLVIFSLQKEYYSRLKEDKELQDYVVKKLGSLENGFADFYKNHKEEAISTFLEIHTNVQADV